jgi:EmrB/QacA subfamily drug resistance transporter
MPRRRALTVLSAATFMIILSETIVNVALRAIQDDLRFSELGLAWVVNAYLVPFGGLLLLAGRVGDLAGRRAVFRAGIAVFTAASLLSGLATSAPWLIVARFAQGIGAALAASVALGMIVTIFPAPDARARAIAVYSFVGAAGASIGVTAGGVITDTLGWNWVFIVNVPVGGAVLLAARTALPADRPANAATATPPDVAGGVAVTAGVMLGVYAIVSPSGRAWAAPAALALLAAFAVRQARAADPLLPLRVLRARAVVVANLVTVVTVAAMIGFQFLVGLYLQRVVGMDAWVAGLAFLPVTVGIAAVSLGVAGRAAARFGPRPVMVGGLLAVLAGYALLTRLPVDATYAVDVLPALALLGAGVGLVLPAVTGLAMSSATDRDSGIASGLLNTTQQVGGALGLAVLATVAAGRTEARRAGGAAEATALVAGYRLAFAVGLALVAAAVVLAAFALPARRREPVPSIR